jgi:starch phosphorylase
MRCCIDNNHQIMMAVAYTIRDRMLQRWLNTIEPLIKKKDTKVVAYLSAEFLMGPPLPAAEQRGSSYHS